MSEQRNLQERLHYQGKLQPVFDRAANYYGVEALPIEGTIDVGYEDFNVRLGDKFVAKVFANIRKPEDVDRYVGIMTAVDQPGINHPHLYKGGGEIAYEDPETKLRMVLMDYIEGKTFYDMDRVPNDDELRAIIKQAVKINQVDYKPSFLFDSWSVTSMDETRRNVDAELNDGDKAIADNLIKEFRDNVSIDNLPHAFVHGDIIKTNVIKREADGRMFIIDFSVANWYPRIQELAVIAANLLGKDNGLRSIEEKINLVSRLYQDQGGSLTEQEIKALSFYVKAAVLMEFLGVHQYINKDSSAESKYWLESARQGLASWGILKSD